MNFEAKKNFKKRNLTITVNDVEEIYDTEGNLMHDNKATFYINSFIDYPETTEKAVKAVGLLCTLQHDP